MITVFGSKKNTFRIPWETFIGYGLLLPSMLIFLVFYYVPGVFLAYISFFHWNIFSSDSTFVGLGNFRILFNQPLFWRSLLNSLYYAVVMVPASTMLSLGIALLLREGIHLKRGAVVRSMVFLPHVTPIVATSIIWLWLFDPQFGLFNSVLGYFHFPQPGWLGSTHWAMPSVMIYSLWHSVGLYTVLFLGALTTLPRSVLEAAKVDGAKKWYLFRRVILPLVSPVTFLVIVLSTIDSLQSFSQIYTLTGGPHGGAGGPAFSTTTDSILIYQTAFLYQHFSLASAMSLILFILILALTLMQKWIADRLVFYR